jgi:hypothetical protein
MDINEWEDKKRLKSQGEKYIDSENLKFFEDHTLKPSE